MHREGPASATTPVLLRGASVNKRWGGLPPGPAVMGVLNVTPDSFSDGGRWRDAQEAVEAGIAMRDAGAAIVDVGGESTRPRAAPIDPAEECRRAIPVVAGLARAGVRISIDTRNAVTMQAALAAGAAIVNDVSALTHDPASTGVVARAGCPVVLMHMRGTPATMHEHAHYDDIASEVASELRVRIDAAVDAGIARASIAIDPGIGFAKTARHNIALLRALKRLSDLDCVILVGVSRKRFIGLLSEVVPPAQRMIGSIVAGMFALSQGATVLRVHDVAETVEAVRVWRALAGGGGEA